MYLNLGAKIQIKNEVAATLSFFIVVRWGLPVDRMRPRQKVPDRGQ